MIDPILRAQVEAWIDADPDRDDRAELAACLADSDEVELRDRFSGPLEFGTAGLRGPLRAGLNGMNLAVVRRTTAGLASWLRGLGGSTVVIGYDARRRSAAFAAETAATLRGAGLVVRLADRAWPTPLTAFAVRWCDADAGIQITASHNPAADNGYKVYDRTGAQIVAPDDAVIAAAVAAQPPASDIPIEAGAPGTIGDDAINAYCAMARSVIGVVGRRRLRIVYTPLCGVGADVMLRLFDECGFADVHVVESQRRPDGAFPGLPFPNPEEPGVLDASYALASSVTADLVVANDPDADRLAIGVPSPHVGWRMLSGDELGLLLGDEMLRRGAGIVARSRVSSNALDAVARRRGSPVVVTPTGFKWLSRAADDSGAALVFAYEEALGYAVTDAVRDKDGITAALVACAIASEVAPLERLAAIAAIDGLHVTLGWSVRFDGADRGNRGNRGNRAKRGERGERGNEIDGPDGRERMSRAIDRLGGGDLVEVEFDEGRAMVRASGTEPKLKCYFETVVDPPTPDILSYEHARELGLETCRRMRDTLVGRLGLA